MKRTCLAIGLSIALLSGGCGDDEPVVHPDLGTDLITDIGGDSAADSSSDSVADSAVDMGPPPNEYVFDRVLVPETQADAAKYGMDVDGDGKVDNLLGAILSTLNSGANLYLQVGMDQAVYSGEILTLMRVDESSTGSVWIGKKQQCCSDPQSLGVCLTQAQATCFSGSHAFEPDPASPTASVLSGTITPSSIDLGPGDLSLRASFMGVGFDLDLKHARIKGTRVGKKIVDAVLAGAIEKEDLDAKIVPAIAEMINVVYTDPTTDPSVKANIETLFDANGDGEITTDELANNALIGVFMAGDVDVNKDNNKELSAGLGFTAIGATITAP